MKAVIENKIEKTPELSVPRKHPRIVGLTLSTMAVSAFIGGLVGNRLGKTTTVTVIGAVVGLVLGFVADGAIQETIKG